MSRFAILRINKLKTLQGIAALGQHCQRLRITPNAEPRRRALNQLLAGAGDFKRDVEARLDVLPKMEKNGMLVPKVRVNAVLAIEHVLTASPDFFITANVEEFRDAAMEWLRETYGEANVVSAVLHMDETTPHVQALVVPIDARGRLNARSFVGGRELLRGLQDSYARKMEPLGLERGVRGSVARHEDVKRWYSQMWEPVARVREELEAAVFADSVVPHVEALTQQLDELSRKAELQERQIAAQAKRERLSQALVDQTRQVDLGTVMEALGGVRDGREKRTWWLDGEKFVITGGQKFYNVTRSQGGGGAIDLVLAARPEYAFRQAVAFVRDQVGADAAVLAAARHAQEITEREPPLPFQSPEPSSANWNHVRSYLIDNRRLPREFVDALHDGGILFADTRYNAVFLRQDDRGEATGAVLCGTWYEKPFQGFVPGTRRDAGYFQVTLPEHEGGHTRPVLVLAENPIEALSYLEMHRRLSEGGRESGPVTVVSLDGATPPHQKIQDTLRHGGIVRVATRDDKAGKILYRQVRDQHPEGEVVHDRARLKDWNEALRWMDRCQRNPAQADRELRAMWARDDPRKRDCKQDRTSQSRQRDDGNRDTYGR